jgi:hypothetical protein
MHYLTDTPLALALVSFVTLWLCARFGASYLGRKAPADTEAHEDLGLVLAATLTLLGLIIGFSFSMATSRYDLRKNYEEAEANAIGTEYLRAQFLPEADAARTRGLLKEYLAQRVLFYRSRDRAQLTQINARTGELQGQLWDSVRAAAGSQPNPINALVVAGMNDVLNSQGYTQAAWWNRIPRAAWTLMILIAVLCNLMLGYATSHLKSSVGLLSVLPVVVAIAFYLIADIDSPRAGFIHIQPQNLLALADTLR